MDRKQAFKKARGLINKTTILYGLRDYDLNDGVDFPLGDSIVQIIKSKEKDIAQNTVVGAFRAKKIRDLNIKLGIAIRELDNTEIQQVANCIMRIFKVSVVEKLNEVVADEDQTAKQSRINTIGKTNNACIFLLEKSSKEIIKRALNQENYAVIEELSTRMLNYLTAVIRRDMISRGMDQVLKRNELNQLDSYSDSSLKEANKYLKLLSKVKDLLKSRGTNQTEQQTKEVDDSVKKFIQTGYSNIF